MIVSSIHLSFGRFLFEVTIEDGGSFFQTQRSRFSCMDEVLLIIVLMYDGEELVGIIVLLYGAGTCARPLHGIVC